MTNEQLAAFIHAGGNDELIPLLWDKVRPLVYMKAGRYYESHIAMCAAHGVEKWDIKQVGYVAFMAALQAFKPESGLKFVTFISFPFRNAVYDLLGVRNKKADALNGALSLDVPVKEDDTDSATLIEFQPDEKSTEFVDRFESAEVSKCIREEVDTLEEPFCSIVKQYYLEGKTLKEIGELRGVSHQRVRQLLERALRELRKRKVLRKLYFEHYQGRYNYAARHKYFDWQPENYAAIRRDEAAARKIAREKSVAEILAEYRAAHASTQFAFNNVSE